MSRIFISYRRADSITFTGRIHDRLRQAFGPHNIFKDVDNIPLGTDFRSVLEDALGKVDVVLVIVGPIWAEITDAEGNQRLHDPEDFVRIEVEQALSRPEVLVIPVLVRGTPMPDDALLPNNIKDLVFRNAATVRDDPDFHRDMDQLIEKLAEYFREQGEDITLPDYALTGSGSNPSYPRRTQINATVPSQQRRGNNGAIIGGVVTVLLLLAVGAWLFLLGPLSRTDPEPTETVVVAAAVTEDDTPTEAVTLTEETTPTDPPPTDAPTETDIPSTEAPATDVPTDAPATATTRPSVTPTQPPTATAAGFGDWRDDYTGDPYTITVRASVRSCASSDCQLFGALRRGTVTTVFDTEIGEAVGGNAEWYLVEYDGEQAYIHSGAARPGGEISDENDASVPSATATEAPALVDEGDPYRVTVRASVRSCPSSDCLLLVALNPGSTVEVIATEIGEAVAGNAEWYEITLDGETGFIHSGAAEPN